ncbi:MAG: hypothetical protein IJX55_10095 [Clostridia bacterium]|nr:hypothetical protein [Clostridia bacterium]
MDNNEKSGFRYTYSAKEQEELKKIREKYEPREEDKMERLRKLDASVGKKARAVALTLGIIGALVLGFGMSLAMSELGANLGLGSELAMLIGVIIGILGGAIACLAYPIYNAVLKSEREKIAPEILRLTDELIK